MTRRGTPFGAEGQEDNMGRRDIGRHGAADVGLRPDPVAGAIVATL